MNLKKLLIVGVFCLAACNESGVTSAPVTNQNPNAGSGSNTSVTPNATTSSSGATATTTVVSTTTPEVPLVTATPAASATATPVPAVPGGVALVWNGTGACTEGCALAGWNAATLAGLTPKYVDDSTLKTSATAAEIAAVFQDVKVWIMPGGHSTNEVNAISPALKTALKSFVQNGGGYVGWCAGAFSATSLVGTTSTPGLGFFPGTTKLYYTSSTQNSYGGSIEKLSWENSIHYFYLEGGPYLTNLPSTVEVISRYDDQVSVAAARTTYGSGRVFISGVHPEAPAWWWKGTSISDPDGTDESYAAEMIKWASHLE